MAINLQEGEAFVAGHSKDKARELLAAAQAHQFDPSVVRSTIGGYIVPSVLLEEPETAKPTTKVADAPPPKKSTTRTRAKKES